MGNWDTERIDGAMKPIPPCHSSSSLLISELPPKTQGVIDVHSHSLPADFAVYHVKRSTYAITDRCTDNLIF